MSGDLPKKLILNVCKYALHSFTPCGWYLVGVDFTFLVGPPTQSGYATSFNYLREQTKNNCFYPFLVLFIFSCRCPLPVVFSYLFYFTVFLQFFGFAMILPNLMCLSDVGKPKYVNRCPERVNFIGFGHASTI